MKNTIYSKNGFLKQACETMKYASTIGIASAAAFLPGCMSEILIPCSSKEPVGSKNISAVVKPSPKESIDSICDSEQVPSCLDNYIENSDIQIQLVPEYVPQTDDSPVKDYVAAEPVQEAPVYIPKVDPVEVKSPEQSSLPPEAPVLKDPINTNDSPDKEISPTASSVDSIVSDHVDKPRGYWIAKQPGIYETNNSKNTPLKENPLDFGTTVALSALASLGSSFVLKYFLAKKSSSLINSAKEAYAFIKSLPELSKPGITEESVREFIQRYSPDTPVLASHFAAKTFMNVLPDANQFSKLELMVFANTVKQYYSCDDKEFCTGVYRIVENYDRSVVEFDDLQKTVVDFSTKKGYSKFSEVASAISSNLSQLNSLSKKQGLSNNRAEYRISIAKAERAVKNNNYDSAVNYFKEALVFNKRRSEAYFGLSDVYLKQNFLVDAAETLDDLIASFPCKPVLSKAYLARASCFVVIGNAQAALGDVRKADSSQLEKYVLEDMCQSMLNQNSVAKKAVNLLKKGFYCYVKPALSYLVSRNSVPPRPSLDDTAPVREVLSDEEYGKLHPVEIYDRFRKNPDLLSDSQKTRFINRLYGDVSIFIKNHSVIKKTSKKILDLVQQDQNICSDTLNVVDKAIDLSQKSISILDDIKTTMSSSQKIGFVAN